MTTKEISLLYSLSLLLPDCNTMEGFGTDIKYVGHSLEEAGEEIKAPDYCGKCSCVYPKPSQPRRC